MERESEPVICPRCGKKIDEPQFGCPNCRCEDFPSYKPYLNREKTFLGFIKSIPMPYFVIFTISIFALFLSVLLTVIVLALVL